MEMIYKYVIYFIIYSFMGWFMEVCVSLWTKRRFINRGFLIGPYCPIYGCGVTLILLLAGNNTQDVFAVFAKSIIICSLLEYLTSYFMEKLFKIRWWDYSYKKFNLNGRVCLDVMISFGVLSFLVVFFVQPFITGLVDNLSFELIRIIAIAIIVILATDCVISYNFLSKIKNQIKIGHIDNTEAIRKHVEAWIEKNSYFYRRIHDSFPRFEVYLKQQKEKLKKASKRGK